MSALAKGLEVLSEFAEGELLGNQQLVERTRLPKATVSRLTSTLAELGYLRQDADSRKFFMGSRLLGMGASVQHRIGLQRAARPFMEALAAETGHLAALGARERLDVVLLDVAAPRGAGLPVQAGVGVEAGVAVGAALPMAGSALGLAYLVAAPLAERTRLIEGLQQHLGARWPAARERIERAHAQHHALGFVTVERSCGREVNAVAVPLELPGKQGLFVFNCAGPACLLPPQRLHGVLGPRLRRMVQAIAAEMAGGATGAPP